MPETLLETDSEIDLPSYPCAVPVDGCTPYADRQDSITTNYPAEPQERSRGGRWNWVLTESEGGGAGLSESWREVELDSHRVGGRWSRALRELEGGGAGLTQSWREMEPGSQRAGGRWSWTHTELAGGGAGLS